MMGKIASQKKLHYFKLKYVTNNIKILRESFSEKLPQRISNYIFISIYNTQVKSFYKKKREFDAITRLHKHICQSKK